MTPDNISFVADGMLQSLGGWLRLLGYDCAGGKDIFGRKALELGLAEGRVVLTRNVHWNYSEPHELIHRARVYVVNATRLDDQLAEVVRKFCLDSRSFLFTRCVDCNAPLAATDKTSAASRIPPRVLQHKEQFWECKACDRIFWRGSHTDRVLQKLAALNL